MTPDKLSRDLVRETPVLRHDDTVSTAVKHVLESGLPAVPVVDGENRLIGIFGEREFMTALFPGYLKELNYAGFVSHALDDALQRRAGCANDEVGKHMNTEHIDVSSDFSDIQLAETFLHHRVLIIPVVDDGKLVGVITRSDYFRRLGEAFLDAS